MLIKETRKCILHRVGMIRNIMVFPCSRENRAEPWHLYGSWVEVLSSVCDGSKVLSISLLSIRKIECLSGRPIRRRYVQYFKLCNRVALCLKLDMFIALEVNFLNIQKVNRLCTFDATERTEGTSCRCT